MAPRILPALLSAAVREPEPDNRLDRRRERRQRRVLRVALAEGAPRGRVHRGLTVTPQAAQLERRLEVCDVVGGVAAAGVVRARANGRGPGRADTPAAAEVPGGRRPGVGGGRNAG